MKSTPYQITIRAIGISLLAICHAFALPIADSQTGFSDRQEENGWSYGEGFGSDFITEGWTFTSGHWESPDRPEIGKAFLGNYPEAFNYEVSYSQAFWKSEATATRAWKCDASYPNARLILTMFFPTQGGKPLRLRVYVNDQEMHDGLVSSEDTKDWFEAASLEMPLKQNDVVYVSISTTEDNSDFTNHGIRAVVLE